MLTTFLSLLTTTMHQKHCGEDKGAPSHIELQPYYVCTTVQVHNMVYSMYYVYMVTKKQEKKVTV